ncbi:MAG: flagellar hook-associated protein FlgK [Polyangiaceae bacterium]
MATLSQLLYTARDALTAQSYGLGVAGQNVANANTDGYVRREAILQNVVLGTQTYGGVEAAGLRRVTDQYLDRRVLAAASLASAASEQDGQLARVEPLLNDFSGTGLGTALDQLFGAFDGVASNPSDPTARVNVLQRAEQLSAHLREIADGIASAREEQLSRGRAVVEQINQKATEIAELNRQISLAEAAGKDAADLRDRLNQMLLGLSTQVDVRTFTDGEGNTVVQAAGTTLVEGEHARSLSIDLAGDGSIRLFAQNGATPGTEVTKYLSGGALAGLVEARDVDLKATADRLDQFAFDLATAVNAQHAAGFGLDGVSGRPLFQVSGTVAGAARSIAVDPSIAGQPDRVAASDSAAEIPGGSGNMTLLSALASSKAASSGTRTFSEAYSDIIGDFATRRASAASEGQLRQDVLTQVQTLQQSESGVSLDEEMVSLTRYQRAYEAAAKVLSTVDELLRELLAKIGS